MFRCQALVGEKGPLEVIWLVAHNRKIRKRDIQNVNLIEVCELVGNSTVDLSLRIKGILLGGIVKVQQKQLEFFIEELRKKLKQLYKLQIGPNMKLQRELQANIQARIESVTLPDANIVSQPCMHTPYQTSNEQELRGINKDSLYWILPQSYGRERLLEVEDIPLQNHQFVAEWEQQVQVDQQEQDAGYHQFQQNLLEGVWPVPDMDEFSIQFPQQDQHMDPNTTTRDVQNIDELQFIDELPMDDLPLWAQQRMQEIDQQYSQEMLARPITAIVQSGNQPQNDDKYSPEKKRRKRRYSRRKFKANIDLPRQTIPAQEFRQWSTDANDLVRQISKNLQNKAHPDYKIDTFKPYFVGSKLNSKLLNLYSNYYENIQVENNQQLNDHDRSLMNMGMDIQMDIDFNVDQTNQISSDIPPGTEQLPFEIVRLSNEFREEQEAIDILRSALQSSVERGQVTQDEVQTPINSQDVGLETPESFIDKLRRSPSGFEFGKMSAKIHSGQRGSGGVADNLLQMNLLPPVSEEMEANISDGLQENYVAENSGLLETSGYSSLQHRRMVTDQQDMKNATTLTLIRVIQQLMLQQHERGQDVGVSLNSLATGLSRMSAAKLFLKCLICTQNSFFVLVNVQTNQDIILWPGVLL
eukprot:TRINITY_DN8005_c0_g1_i2.p1 TRINITY_DN8005_c0_g1~~TRINITY_DN8005_c0_g1_i2.p1  ORF type:complete len:678 (-),score=40.61 TRINITY_DN8005_c0_g1_i2:336-2255(-)